MKIGNNTLKHGLMLAPLAGVSDSVFREICRSLGAEYTVSEMVSAKALCYEQLSKKASAGENSKTAPIARVRSCELPMAVQLFGSEPEYMAKAAKMIAECDYNGCTSECPPSAIDINMGCPVPKVAGNGEGSALMKDPELCGRIVRAVSRSVNIPVTVKMRAGWDQNSKNAVEVARICEANGASAICVHGRTRTQMYEPGVDRKIIADVKKAVSVPVIANGDIFSAKDALSMIDETNCDGIMIARGALGNPWIFADVIAAFENVDFVPPTAKDRIEMAIRHAEAMLKKDGRNGLAEARKHMAWYIKGIPGAASTRNKIMTLSSFDEVKKTLRALTR